jgi:Icc-related predicted phosphoesterase
MTRIYYASDLHLEHRQLDYGIIHPIPNSILVLAGDIVPTASLIFQQNHPDPTSTDFVDFFEIISFKYKHVIYIAGNHSLYGSQYNCIGNLKRALAEYTNIHVLDCESITLEGIDFYGGTCWTDFNKEDPETLLRAPKTLMDFRVIKEGTGKFLPSTALKLHKQYLVGLDKFLNTAKNKTVVVSHHSPSHATINPIYKDQYHMNGLFSSDLTEYMEGIDYFIYGHMHSGLDVVHGDCHVITNPRGYPHEPSHRNFQMRYFDL